MAKSNFQKQLDMANKTIQKTLTQKAMPKQPNKAKQKVQQSSGLIGRTSRSIKKRQDFLKNL